VAHAAAAAVKHCSRLHYPNRTRKNEKHNILIRPFAFVVQLNEMENFKERGK
jgi:hypothetical protein